MLKFTNRTSDRDAYTAYLERSKQVYDLVQNRMNQVDHCTRLSKVPTITEFRALDKDEKFMAAMKKLDPNFTKLENLIDLDKLDVRVVESRDKET